MTYTEGKQRVCKLCNIRSSKTEQVVDFGDYIVHIRCYKQPSKFLPPHYYDRPAHNLD